ncbi:MAG: hypothetical protein M0Z81_12545 [Deltaproteobacteria bacterium]|jgi:hypothetical protein|nr:hypothetical protein [Deltaproteobacteria bacterium]
MKRAIVALVTVLVLVGFVGLSDSMAATPKGPYACVSMPANVEYINVHSVQCPVGANHRQAPKVMGSIGF